MINKKVSTKEANVITHTYYSASDGIEEVVLENKRTFSLFIHDQVWYDDLDEKRIVDTFKTFKEAESGLDELIHCIYVDASSYQHHKNLKSKAEEERLKKNKGKKKK